MPHQNLPPSPWITRFESLLRSCAADREVPRGLDLACGHGRHVRWLAARGWRMTAVDRDGTALATLADLGDRVHAIEADIEGGPWPLEGRAFDAVVVTNYLWRPLLPRIVASVAPGGVLLYETFALGNETVGRPSRPDFLLAPGELLQACAGLRIVAFEDGFLNTPERFVQRVAAVRELQPGEAPPRRYPL